MKPVAELDGVELDDWVARALRMESYAWGGWAPSTEWEDGGPLIELKRISVYYDEHRACWQACPHALPANNPGPVQVLVMQSGPDALTAAMRAIVASRFGETVEDAT